jgi:pimeloyl-ACP methyl ester carboxylesterase
MPRLARPSDRAWFSSPVLVIAAEHDLLFPPARVLPAARALFPNLVSATILRDSGHIMSPAAAKRLSARLQEFFTAG